MLLFVAAFLTFRIDEADWLKAADSDPQTYNAVRVTQASLKSAWDTVQSLSADFRVTTDEEGPQGRYVEKSAGHLDWRGKSARREWELEAAPEGKTSSDPLLREKILRTPEMTAVLSTYADNGKTTHTLQIKPPPGGFQDLSRLSGRHTELLDPPLFFGGIPSIEGNRHLCQASTVAEGRSRDGASRALQ